MPQDNQNSVISQNLSPQQKKIFFYSGIGWMFDAMDVGLLSFILVALAADWGLGRAELAGLTTANAVGMAVGALAFGLLADRIGRRTTFVATLLTFALASGLSAFANSLIILVILRFFIGLGLGGELPVAATYVSEHAPAPIRGRLVVLLESFWAVGWLLAALIAYFVMPLFSPNWGWRVALLCGAVPALYALYLRRNLPADAPQALDIQKKKSTTRERLAALWAAPSRRATAVLWLLWFIVVFSYYGMFLWLPSVLVARGFEWLRSFEYVLWMTLAQLPGYFCAAWLIEKIGRRWTLAAFLMGTAAAALGFSLAQTNGQIWAFGALLSFFNLGAWGALYAYSPEIYAAPIRTSGVGVAAAVGRIGGIIGPLMIPLLENTAVGLNGIFAIFAVSLMLGSIVLIIFGPETKNSTY